MSEIVAVVGAGTMGHGIAQVCAMSGYTVRLTDNQPEGLSRGIAKIRQNLDTGVAKGKVTVEARDGALARLAAAATPLEAAEGADVVIEAIPEVLAWKQALFRDLARVTAPACLFGTNTSSLSITNIAAEIPGPERVIGLHFFNPVHLMSLLEIVVAECTSESTLERARVLGSRLGKEVIVVRDTPGFATSRLGVALGMEAIRMLESGVASAEDIDKAMVLGYRHPVGPLKLTDMVGLDVRQKIGEYLARELGNPAFEPPPLLRQMVAEGRLGQKSGRGFYNWE